MLVDEVADLVEFAAAPFFVTLAVEVFDERVQLEVDSVQGGSGGTGRGMRDGGDERLVFAVALTVTELKGGVRVRSDGAAVDREHEVLACIADHPHRAVGRVEVDTPEAPVEHGGEAVTDLGHDDVIVFIVFIGLERDRVHAAVLAEAVEVVAVERVEVDGHDPVVAGQPGKPAHVLGVRRLSGFELDQPLVSSLAGGDPVHNPGLFVEDGQRCLIGT